MKDFKSIVVDKIQNLDLKMLSKSGLNLDFQVDNPLDNLSNLQSYLDDYVEFFNDPLVLTLINKQASTIVYNINQSKDLRLNSSEIFNSIVIINVKENLSLNIFIEDTAVLNSAILIIAEKNANVETVFVGKSNSQACVYEYFSENSSGQTVVINKNNQKFGVNYLSLKSFLCGVKAVHNYNVFSDSFNAKSYLYVTNHFKTADCKGEIWIDGILDQSSFARIIGAINIDLTAGNTDSYMKKDILMIDDKSKLDCVPALEIKTNDVKAGHGVSVSKFDKEKKFYLQSRGLNEKEVIDLVCDGLLHKYIDKINSTDLKNHLLNTFEC